MNSNMWAINKLFNCTRLFDLRDVNNPILRKQVTYMASIEQHYNNMADKYHLYFPDWNVRIEDDSRWFCMLIKKLFGQKALDVLDCTCGIGTQVIALSQLGHNVTASDISSEAIRRAKHECQVRNINSDFFVAPLTSLNTFRKLFDIVVSMDNGIPHIMSYDELVDSFRAVHSVLRDEGYFVASIRDYDSIKVLKPDGFEPYVGKNDECEWISFQFWNWLTSDTYELHEYMNIRGTSKDWEAFHSWALYRTYERSQITKALKMAGFSKVVWEMPDVSGYYQPVLIAS